MGDQAAGFLRSPDGSIATFQVSGAQATYPNSINNTDTVAGSYFEGNHYQSFLRTSDGTITELDPFGADGSQASAIDKRGSIVGIYYFARDTYDQGYLRTDGGKFVKVNFPKSVGTAPQSINDMDVIAGFYVDAARVAHGFVRSP
jgi:hypothetical protein